MNQGETDPDRKVRQGFCKRCGEIYLREWKYQRYCGNCKKSNIPFKNTQQPFSKDVERR